MQLSTARLPSCRDRAGEVGLVWGCSSGGAGSAISVNEVSSGGLSGKGMLVEAWLAAWEVTPAGQL